MDGDYAVRAAHCCDPVSHETVWGAFVLSCMMLRSAREENEIRHHDGQWLPELSHRQCRIIRVLTNVEIGRQAVCILGWSGLTVALVFGEYTTWDIGPRAFGSRAYPFVARIVPRPTRCSSTLSDNF